MSGLWVAAMPRLTAAVAVDARRAKSACREISLRSWRASRPTASRAGHRAREILLYL